MGLLAQMLGRGTEQRGFGDELAKIPGPAEGYRSFAGPVITENAALHHIDVWKCVSLISDAVASLPLRAYRRQAVVDANGELQTHASRLARQPMLLTDPMPGDFAPEFSFKHRVMTSLLLNGNTYNEIGGVDAAGFPSMIMPVHPDKVREVRLNRLGMPEFVMHDGGVMGSFRDGGTMVHWPGFIESGKLMGISPIKAGMQGIALSVAAERFGARWFGDGANPSGYLKHPGEATPEEAKEAKAAWVRTYSGLSREPAFLYGGLEWHPISVNPDESQFIETRQHQAGQIAGLFRVPPHLVGDVNKTTSWGTGIEEQGLGFVVYTLGPWLARFEQAMTLLLPRGQFAKFNVGALLRGKIKDRYAAYATARQWGWMSVNDIRSLEDMAPIDGGDIYLQPLNMVEANEALDLLRGSSDLPGVPDMSSGDNDNDDD